MLLLSALLILAGEDFYSNISKSVFIFDVGLPTRQCTMVTVVDDGLFEEAEFFDVFMLVLPTERVGVCIGRAKVQLNGEPIM
jgi:hypothetical protein